MSKHTERGSKYLKALYACYNKYWDEMRDFIPEGTDPSFCIWTAIAADAEDMLRRRQEELWLQQSSEVQP